MRYGRLALLAVVVLAIVPLSPAQGGNGAALVLEKSGTSEPELQAYGEIPAGTSVSLGAKARLVFLHYRRCAIVTAIGGKVAIDTQAYTVTGGERPQEVSVPCPQRTRLKEEAN